MKTKLAVAIAALALAGTAAAHDDGKAPHDHLTWEGHTQGSLEINNGNTYRGLRQSDGDADFKVWARSEGTFAFNENVLLFGELGANRLTVETIRMGTSDAPNQPYTLFDLERIVPANIDVTQQEAFEVVGTLGTTLSLTDNVDFTTYINYRTFTKNVSKSYTEVGVNVKLIDRITLGAEKITSSNEDLHGEEFVNRTLLARGDMYAYAKLDTPLFWKLNLVAEYGNSFIENSVAASNVYAGVRYDISRNFEVTAGYTANAFDSGTLGDSVKAFIKDDKNLQSDRANVGFKVRF